jgi:hypothetical protein
MLNKGNAEGETVFAPRPLYKKEPRGKSNYFPKRAPVTEGRRPRRPTREARPKIAWSSSSQRSGGMGGSPVPLNPPLPAREKNAGARVFFY